MIIQPSRGCPEPGQQPLGLTGEAHGQSGAAVLVRKDQVVTIDYLEEDGTLFIEKLRVH